MLLDFTNRRVQFIACFAFLFCLLVGACPAWAISPSFKPIGFLPMGGTFSNVGGISPDGKVVVGQSNEDFPSLGQLVNRAIRWENGTMESLGFLNVDPISNIGFDANLDGTTIVGTETAPQNQGSTVRGWQWKQGGGMVALNAIANDATRAEAISYDGSVIAGSSDVGTPFFNAARWVNLAPVNDGTGTGDDSDLSSNTGISGDGLVTAGSSNFPDAQNPQNNNFHAHRKNGGFTDLGTLDDIFNSNGKDISGDGQVVVGLSALQAGGIEAFRWQGGVMTGLGDLPGGTVDSEALATDHDGDVIVGRGRTDAGDEAFLWTESSGMVNVKDLLESFGLDLTGWTLTEATAVSADGFTIAGNGINPSGGTEGWVATVVPEPSSMVLVLLGIAGCVAIGRRRRESI